MAILVGIDEAGYGPVLGPLVVSATVFELPDEHLMASLWDILRQSVCKRRAGSAGRIAINDSKKLHSAKSRYQILQRSVLASLAALDSKQRPITLAELLDAVGGCDPKEFNRYPWYGDAVGAFRLDYDRDDIDTAATALRHTMEENQVRLLDLWSKPLLAGEYNRQVEASQNKATVLFGQVSRFIDTAQRQYGPTENNLQIVIDKHGGRSHYRALLQKLFPELTMKILKETDAVSSYQMHDREKKVKIHFVAKGDDRHLPVALASMASKLVRELFMELLNHYFKKQCPGIKPTAGYYQDGQRFLSEIKGKLEPALMPRELLVRSR